MAKRKLGHIIAGIIIGGVIGSVLSSLLSGIFPKGPVKNFFFSALKIGFSAIEMDLGFFNFTIGLGLNITLVTVIFIFLTMYLLHKL